MVNSEVYVEAIKLLTEGVAKLSHYTPKVEDDPAVIALEWVDKKLKWLESEHSIPRNEWYSSVLYAHIRESLFTVQTLLEDEVRASHGVYV